MTTGPKDKHLSELISKFYSISKAKYNGKTYDNVLNIFDELDLEEQKELIRGTIGVYSVTTSTVIHDREVIDFGDGEAFLNYLKGAQETRDKTVTGTSGANAPISASKTEDKGDKRVQCYILAVVLALILFVMQTTDDHTIDSVAKATSYKNAIEIIKVFVD